MSVVSELLQYNRQFVENKGYEEYLTDKYPDKQIAILTCMDTRLVELLPKALNLRNGDAKIIKNAGAILTQPFGSAMRSILIAIYEMGVKEVFVIGHHGCGMTGLNADGIIEKIKAQGIPDIVLETLNKSGIRMERFLKGFQTVEEGIMQSVEIIRNHPLLPKTIPVHAFVMHPDTGEMELLSEGYEYLKQRDG
ncbi:beta-class carbonic anhydrase [Cohnella terricola]|uniref:carbonic anhydrase n=1 Tax=Cohnella terricola TaxID=1289167 RepID=A0A559JFZ4_9BACL|nr:carbonic anhydrase [Cohnella terricola]TVX98799.1 carbonic anhydrase [Cohnella terricola]